MQRPRAAQDKADDDDEDDEEEEEEEESSESEEEELGPGGSSVAQPEMTRAERKALKKSANPKKKAPADEEEEDEDDDLVNPNHVSATSSKKISNLNSPQPLSRRERWVFDMSFFVAHIGFREAKEKQEAKERYWKMHLEGKTDQAKADLARLAKIRKDREEAQMKRKAEADGMFHFYYGIVTLLLHMNS